jgi:hypothetical protein
MKKDKHIINANFQASNYSINRPASLRDLERLLKVVSAENFYVKPETYRRIIGFGRTQFYMLKKAGRFDAGMHPATLGSKHILIHKNFNMHSQKIEWFGIEKITPNKRSRKQFL